MVQSMAQSMVVHGSPWWDDGGGCVGPVVESGAGGLRLTRLWAEDVRLQAVLMTVPTGLAGFT